MRIINKKIFIMASFLMVPSAGAPVGSALAASRCRAPSWFTGPETVTEGDQLIVRCSATAIVDEIAEMKAVQICENSAIAEVLIRAVKNRPSRPATEVGPPADLATPPCIVGLTCDSAKMRSCKSEDEATVWRRCSYNLASAHEGTKKECGVPTVAEEPVAKAPTEEPLAKASEMPPTTEAPTPPVSDFMLTITTNPICDEVVVAGASERRYQCPSTLIEIPITAGDTTITILARGHSDKSITVESLGSERRVDISFDPLPTQ
ncbi:MAG: hypothetical protein RL011_967 [Pseudomonadota bacterium]|jgi:hypothetical protein